MGLLNGQVALVTGAGRGFGKAIALRYAKEGAAVAVTARSAAELDAVVAEITSGGGTALAVPADIALSADISRLVATTQSKLGPLSLIVSNAGVPGPFGPLWVNDPETWWRAQEVHIKGPMVLMHAALPGMVERRKGRVIFVSAIASYLTVSGLSAYCIGKAAQRRLAELLAFETKEHGLAVFSIDPGFVFTQLAEETMNAPDAQRWLPQMVARLKEMKAGNPIDADLEKCAQRCVDLASGKYDALSGCYSELTHDLDKMLSDKKRG